MHRLAEGAENRLGGSQRKKIRIIRVPEMAIALRAPAKADFPACFQQKLLTEPERGGAI
jgi:hypothetical protein